MFRLLLGGLNFGDDPAQHVHRDRLRLIEADTVGHSVGRLDPLPDMRCDLSRGAAGGDRMQYLVGDHTDRRLDLC